MERLPRKDSFPEIDFLTILDDISEEETCSEFRQKEKAGQLLPEPLLIGDNSRFVLFPIKHTDVSIFWCWYDLYLLL